MTIAAYAFPTANYKVRYMPSCHRGLNPMNIEPLSAKDLNDIMECNEPEPEPFIVNESRMSDGFEDMFVVYDTCIRSICLERIDTWMQSSANPDITNGPVWWKNRDTVKRVFKNKKRKMTV
jgi:hypothetical protein